MQDDLEQAICNYEKKGYNTQGPDREPEPPAKDTLRDRLDRIIHSHKFMVSVIVLVVLDCALVIALLLIDLKIIHLTKDHHFVHQILHYSSVSILCIFLIEIGIRLYVLRLKFFKHKLEVFDAIVVIISFILDIIFRDNEDATSGTGLLILLRLWRVTRILNGIILSVKKQAEDELTNEKRLRSTCEENIVKYQRYTMALEAELARLQEKLKKPGVHPRPEEKAQFGLSGVHPPITINMK